MVGNMSNRSRKMKKSNMNPTGKRKLLNTSEHKNQWSGQIKKYGRYGLGALLALVPPAALFYLLEFYTHNPFVEVRPWAQLFNVVLFELMAGIIFCFTGRLRAAYRIEAVVAMIFGIANAYVMRFRTNPIVPWDIFSWKTAASVVNNYDFTPDVRMVIVTIIFILFIVACHFIRVDLKKIVIWKRLIPGVTLVVALAVFANVLQQESFQNSHRLYNKLFTPVFMTEVDGIPVTFVMNLAYMSIDKPQGYQAAEAKNLLQEYETQSGAVDGDQAGQLEGITVSEDNMQQTEDLPNIIVVMNESFSDLGVLGELETNRDYMPYLHSLQQGAPNTVTGMLNVSVCGGNTANSEFEFLTGNTMAFLPQGSVPYQQYINGERETLASHLKKLGYQTVATHPYNATGWERDTVYPWMGFDRSIFLEGYGNAARVRNYVSDDSCVDKIIEFYEHKNDGQPLFVFNVTMQNHGGYQDFFSNFTPEITAGLNNFSLDQYLSLVELSDQSLEKLISYFSKVDEKTVVVFFGDHQPNDTVAASVLAQNGMAWNALTEEELKLRYQVPYVIWANYDIKEAQNADTSANYLGAEVLARAGVPTYGYQNFLLELKEDYPVISTVRRVGADGNENSAVEENEKMETYRKLQYYELFDWKEESEE